MQALEHRARALRPPGAPSLRARPPGVDDHPRVAFGAGIGLGEHVEVGGPLEFGGRPYLVTETAGPIDDGGMQCAPTRGIGHADAPLPRDLLLTHARRHSTSAQEVARDQNAAAVYRVEAMIEVDGLTKRYREHVAVEGLSFAIGKGEVVGFLGPNGAGKSTTMRILAGYMPATSGAVRLGGVDVFDEPLQVKRRIGYLPEMPPVYLDMTVRGYLRFVAKLKGVARKELRREVKRVAELAGVEHILGRLIRNVSKGYRQRVGIAQALLGDPEVLILDEPTVGLDPIQIEQVRKLITDLGASGRHTIVLSTHILREVEATCQRIIMIARGRIVADDSLEALEAAHEAPLEKIFARLAVG